MKLKNTTNRLLCFWKFWGTKNYYEGVDKPTLWQWLYAWRVSPKNAWKLSGIIWATKPTGKS